MADIEFHPVMERLLELEARIRATDERQAAIETVLVLLLAQLPGDDGRRLLLAKQTNLIVQGVAVNLPRPFSY